MIYCVIIIDINGMTLLRKEMIWLIRDLNSSRSLPDVSLGEFEHAQN